MADHVLASAVGATVHTALTSSTSSSNVPLSQPIPSSSSVYVVSMRTKMDALFLRWLSMQDTRYLMDMKDSRDKNVIDVPLSTLSSSDSITMDTLQKSDSMREIPMLSASTSSTSLSEANITQEDVYNSTRQNGIIPPLSPSSSRVFGRNLSSRTRDADEASTDIYSSAAIAIETTRVLSPTGSTLSLSLLSSPVHHASTSRSLLQALTKDEKRLSRSASSSLIPPFYFPFGKSLPRQDERRKRHQLLATVKPFFGQESETNSSGIDEIQFVRVTQATGLPRYLNAALFRRIDTKQKRLVCFNQFSKVWKSLNLTYFDEVSLVYGILKQENQNYLTMADWMPVLTDVVMHHPGLEFLQAMPLFQERYIETVISRIFYSVNRSWTGKMTLGELRKSSLLTVLRHLEQSNDINLHRDYFSYKHFYVIYCKFWELDTDHDLHIDQEALSRYDNGALNEKIIARVIQGNNVKNVAADHCPGKMTYREFICFLISEEDKSTPMAIEYWFRVMDLDGDGIISLYEMEYFFADQSNRMERMNVETITFEDAICQILDLIEPAVMGQVTLRDLKKSAMAHVFFDLFCNLSKFISYEQRDMPLGDEIVGTGGEKQRWDRFAEFEYDQMSLDEEVDDAASESGLGVVQLSRDERQQAWTMEEHKEDSWSRTHPRSFEAGDEEVLVPQ